MNEDTLGRQPIELMEIRLPRCVNTYGSAPCTAAAGAGGECYNTRATCQDAANYRGTPDGHLTPSFTKANLENVLDSELDTSDSLFAAFDVQFAAEPDGQIWNQGDEDGGTDGVYFHVSGGNLILRVGRLNVTSGTNTANITVDAAQFASKRLTLFVQINLAPINPIESVRLWSFDALTRRLELIGFSPFELAGTGVWASSDLGGIGALRGVGVGLGLVQPWNGFIYEARFYNNSLAPENMTDTFSQSLWLGRGVKGEPTDEVYIIPALQSVGTIGTKINLSGADDDYKPLGRRATLDFTARDFNHSDVTQDPYLSTRTRDPLTSGTFWPRWLARQKFGKVGATVIRHTGYAGQRLSEYQTETYILESVKQNEDGVSGYCRDELARTEGIKALVPATSQGLLAADITDAATSLTLSGEFDANEYPEEGTVRIGDEIMTYTGKTVGSGITTLTGLTRGTDGSTAEAHETDDVVQICYRVASGTVESVVRDLLLNQAQIRGQLVDLDELASEQSAYLADYSLTTLITEPTPVDTVLGWVSRECSCYIFWDVRSGKVRLKAIRAVGAAEIVQTLSYEDHIIKGSFSIDERPRQRVNVINAYFNPVDFAGDLEKPTNYKNGRQIINGTTSDTDQYGDIVQSRVFFSRFLTSDANIIQTGARLSLRYADVPRFVEFYVDAKDRNLWVGDIIRISHPLIALPTGEREIRRWLIVEAEETDPGHLVRFMCADITLDGFIYTITENGVGDYTAELFADGNFFITDNNGLNPDGTEGATIN